MAAVIAALNHTSLARGLSRRHLLRALPAVPSLMSTVESPKLSASLISGISSSANGFCNFHHQAVNVIAHLLHALVFCDFFPISFFLCFCVFMHSVLRFIVNARFPRFDIWARTPSLCHTTTIARRQPLPTAACALIGSTHSGFGCWFPLFIYFAGAVCVFLCGSHIFYVSGLLVFSFFALETLNAAQLLGCA